jgi:hypothetical protein
MVRLRGLGGCVCGLLLGAAAWGDAVRPPIPITFTLAEPGYVTLVIENLHGVRVRNLISETPYPAGQQTVWWDGLDDLARDTNAAAHAVYHVPGKVVAPGEYRVRGLVRKALTLRYEMSVYTHGNPPWNTGKSTSQWLTNHTPPGAIIFVPAGQAPVREGGAAPSPPQVLIGSDVAEGGSGLAWVDLAGKKLHGQMWLGGVWTGASYLTRDVGPAPVPGIYAYAGSAWGGDKYNGNMPELRLHKLVNGEAKLKAPRDTRMGTGEDPPVLAPTYKLPERGLAALGGLAAYNGLLVASLPKMNRLLFIDVAGQKALGTLALEDPRGMAFTPQGALLVISQGRVVRVTPPAIDQFTAAAPAAPPQQLLIADGLLDPQQLALDADGNLYVSDRGTSHQVKVFSPGGQFLRAIGTPGAPGVGAYDPTHLNNPKGIAVSDDGHLWVTETEFQPKRVSVWTLNGKLVTAYYGPTRYGGGGTRDPRDPSRYFLDGIEFKLDPATGRSWPLTIYYRADDKEKTGWGIGPERPLYIGDRQYLTNCYNISPTSGASVASIYRKGADGVAKVIAAAGNANECPPLSAYTQPARHFSVRWTGQVQPKYSETYTFIGMADDACKLRVNGQLLFDQRSPKVKGERSGEITLEAGRRYALTLEYFQTGGGEAKASLFWSSPRQKRELLPRAQLFPTVEATEASGLSATYFRGDDLTQPVATQVDPGVNFNWKKQPTACFLPTADDPMRTRLPQGYPLGDPLFFIWADGNGDGAFQAPELSFLPGTAGKVTVMADLAFAVSRLNDAALRFPVLGYTKDGIPQYDCARGETLVSGVQRPTSSGGDQVLTNDEGWTICTTAPKPFAAQSLGGAYKGEPRWSYPSLWPGLHASHIAPLPEFPGEVIGTTRLLGGFIRPKGSDIGDLWAINGNKGTVYLFTADGLFVATLFKDCRTASWKFPAATAGMDVSEASIHEEDFWPSITQAEDGTVSLAVLNADLVRLEGLETLKRLPDSTLTVTPAQLQAAQAYFVAAEEARQAAQAIQRDPLTVARLATAPTLDGKLDDWKGAVWVTIDTRTTQVGDWGKRKTETKAALAIAGDRLFAAYQTNEADLLTNSGESLQNLFKTGGALDLMLDALPGGERLLVARVKGKTTAVLYRPRVPGTATEPVPFGSPLRTVTFDRVDDVSPEVQLASHTEKDKDGRDVSTIYELSVPLALLGLLPTPATLRGDIGLLRGNGFTTMQRVYWYNKATSLVSDIPSEAELLPKLWGPVQIGE